MLHKQFNGSITTTGKSEAIRIEKSFFRLNPEFQQQEKVKVQVIAPGHVLISLVDEQKVSELEADPIIEAFLAFLTTQMEQYPEQIKPLSESKIAQAIQLTEGMSVSNEEELPEDFEL